MQQITGQTSEDFRTIGFLDTTTQTNGNITYVDFISPYANRTDFDEINGRGDIIPNWLAVNRTATMKYMQTGYGSAYTGQKISPDYAPVRTGVSREKNWDLVNGSDIGRAPLSRHYWSGRIASTDTDQYFTYSQYDDGKDCDGFLHLLDPTQLFAGGGAYSQYFNTSWFQGAMTAELQFDNLPAFTWVPVGAITIRRSFFNLEVYKEGYTGGGHMYSANIESNLVYHANGERVFWNMDCDGPNEFQLYDSHNDVSWDNTRWIGGTVGAGWTLPAGIDHNTSSNWYGKDMVYPYWGLFSVHVIYCHDGNGNGMLATCGGMLPTNETTSEWITGGQNQWDALGEGHVKFLNKSHLAYNDVGGQAGYEGMMQFKPPQKLVDWFANDTGSATTRLQRLWDEFSNNKYGYNVWGDWEEDRQVDNRNLTRDQGEPVHNPGAVSQPGETGGVDSEVRYAGGGGYDADLTRKLSWHWRSYWGPRTSGLLLAYGPMGDNANLSSPVNFYLNRACAGGGRSGFNTSARVTSPYGYFNHTGGDPSKSQSEVAIFLSGKLGNLSFTGAPAYSHCHSGYDMTNGYMKHYTFQSLIAPGWIIQPTVLGQGRVNKFAITSYFNKQQTDPTGAFNYPYVSFEDMSIADGDNIPIRILNAADNFSTATERLWDPTNASSGLVVPDPEEVYEFPLLSSFAGDYDALLMNGDDLVTKDRFEYTTGTWENVENAVDDDNSTVTTILSTGEASALFIKLNEVDTNANVTANTLVKNVNARIGGLKVAVIGNYSLYIDITDENKNTLISGNKLQFSDFSTGSGKTIPPNGLWNINIDGGTTTYGQISGGYVKIYISE